MTLLRKKSSAGLRILRVLIYPEEGGWIGHVLNFDFAAQGKDPNAAKNNVIKALPHLIVEAMRNKRLPELWKTRAPQELWDRFLSAVMQNRPVFDVVPIDGKDLHRAWSVVEGDDPSRIEAEVVLVDNSEPTA